jgi:hypothetical protein
MIERSASWLPGAAWQLEVTVVRIETEAAVAPVAAVGPCEALLAGSELPAGLRRRIEAIYAFALLAAGRTAEALHVSIRNRTPAPLNHYRDQLVWLTYTSTSLNGGHDLRGLDAWARQAFAHATETRDRVAVGLAAVALGHLRMLEGRYTEARRWLAEADQQGKAEARRE